MSTGKSHYEAAELILASIGSEKDSEWSQALATRALVHATLAVASRDLGLAFDAFRPEKPSEATLLANAEFDAIEGEPKILFQGSSVQSPRETNMKKNLEAEYTKSDAIRLNWHLNNHEDGL